MSHEDYEGFEVVVIKPGILVRDRFGNILDARSTVTLIKNSGQNIIVDTGLSNERQAVLDGLEEQNLKPSDINILINTHRHPDHTGNNDLFQNAQYLVHESEFFRSRDQQDIKLVKSDIVLIPGIQIIETPGHSHGSISIIVTGQIANLGTQPIALTGDALPIMDNYVKWVPPGIHYDPKIALESMSKITELADIIIPGHDRPFRIIKDNNSQRKAQYL